MAGLTNSACFLTTLAHYLLRASPYAYLRKLFHDLRIREGCQHNNVFSWHQPRMNQDDCSPRTPSVDVGANRTKENEKAGASYSDRVWVFSRFNLSR